MELLITITAILVLSAMGIGVYFGVISKADTGGIVNNINQLKQVVQTYAENNGGSLNNISAANLQSNGILPSNWSVSGSLAVPPNAGVVSGYYITQGADGMTGDAFDIGFTGPNITNNIVQSVCDTFENYIIEFAYNGTAYPVSTGGTNCGVIPSNNDDITAPFYLGFE